MGVYDFFKGRCPQCHQDIDYHPEFGKCGDIQTKLFDPLPEPGLCFRDFYPGQKLPFAPGRSLVIGRTCCCETLIKACFHDDLLLEYTVAVGQEKYEYLRREWTGSSTSQDRNWFVHCTQFNELGLEEDIIRQALHPHRISYYLSKGHSIEDICSS